MTIQVTIRNDEKPGGKTLYLVPFYYREKKDVDGFAIAEEKGIVSVRPGATVIVSVYDLKYYTLEEK